MRLTLRTLLAYLDDILEPSHAKEIGEKIQESALASSLINRIREAMRRRRLTAPQVSGPGADVDANTVAEYLDNTLSPEAVADVERICLESDIHLAEVAASHQILTLVLGEPVEIVPQSRERMYALGPAPRRHAPEPVAAAPVAVAAAPHPTYETSRTPAVAPVHPSSFEETIPDYLKPKPFWRRALPYAAILVGGALYLGFFAQEFNFWPATQDPQQAERAPAVASADVNADKVNADGVESPDEAVEPAPAAPGEAVVDEDDPAVAAAAADAAAAENLANLDPPPPPDLPEEDLPPEEPEVVVAKAPAKPAVDPEVKKPAVEAPAAVAPPKAPVVRPAQYASTEGVLLRQDAQDGAWYVMPRRAVVQPGEVVAVPEPFEAVLLFGKNRDPMKLHGGTAVRVLESTDAAPWGIEVLRGRVEISAAKGTPEAPGVGPTLAVSVRGDLWRLDLLTPESVAGIEVVPRSPTRFEEDFGKNTYTGHLYAAQGPVRFADAAQHVQTVEAPGSTEFGPAVGAAEGVGAAAELADVPVPTPDRATIPEWLSARKGANAPGNYARLFEREFDPTDAVALTLGGTVKHRLFEISRLAVACLSLIGDYDGLITALERGEHEEARLEAIKGLREWVNLDPQNRELLKTTLTTHFHEDEAEALYRLIWGYSPEEARDPVVSTQLVDWLSSDSLPIRELAFYHVLRLTGRRYEYRPNASPAQRKAAVNQWLKHLEKDGALLPATEKAAGLKPRRVPIN